jgi:hypothetical protein
MTDIDASRDRHNSSPGPLDLASMEPSPVQGSSEAPAAIGVEEILEGKSFAAEAEVRVKAETPDTGKSNDAEAGEKDKDEEVEEPPTEEPSMEKPSTDEPSTEESPTEEILQWRAKMEANPSRTGRDTNIPLRDNAILPVDLPVTNPQPSHRPSLAIRRWYLKNHESTPFEFSGVEMYETLADGRI